MDEISFGCTLQTFTLQIRLAAISLIVATENGAVAITEVLMAMFLIAQFTFMTACERSRLLVHGEKTRLSC